LLAVIIDVIVEVSF